MLGLVAERAGHAAAGRIEGLDLESRHQLEGGEACAHDVESLLMAVAVDERLAGTWLRLEFETARGAFLSDEFLEELGALGKRRGVGAGEKGGDLIAQGEETGGLQSDNGRA